MNMILNANATEAEAEEAANSALTISKEVNFHFREKLVKAEDGTTSKVKRESVTISLPYLTIDGLVDCINEDEKALAYLVEEVNQAIYLEAKIQVDADSKIDQDSLDLTKLSLAALCRKPKSDSRGGGISKEFWASFVKHYVSTMPELAGVNTQKATLAAGLFNRRLADVKSNKKVLELLQGQLSLWFTQADGAEAFTPIYEVLSTKIETFLEDDGQSMLGNLM